MKQLEITETTKVSDILKHIQKRVKLRDYPDYAICVAVDSHFESRYHKAKLNFFNHRAQAFAAWPKYSGSRHYPVPSPFKVDLGPAAKYYGFPVGPAQGAEMRFDVVANKQYFEGMGLFWKGPYGTLRKELLAFLIAWFSERGM